MGDDNKLLTFLASGYDDAITQKRDLECFKTNFLRILPPSADPLIRR